jgi:oxygen-dependent protoporphyrinogen oxidase
VVALGFDAKTIGGAPEGFGFLAPRGEGLRILGCLWDSSIFPATRAPEGKVLLRAMIGGALDPEAIRLSDAELLAAVRTDLRRAMGLAAEPERVWLWRHELGISQYTVGHSDRLAAIDRALARLPGLHLAGQSYHGIAMNAAIEHAGKLAAAIVDELGSGVGAEAAVATAG